MEQTRTPPDISSLTKRAPLTERQPRARRSSNVSKASGSSKLGTPSRIPHHESIHPEGNLSVVTRPHVPSPRPRNDRIVAIAEDEPKASKRDSQISTTSTVSSSKAKRKTHIGPWQLGRTLGKGATGRVRLAKHAFTGQTAAIKIVSKKSAALVQSASMRKMDDDLTSNISGARTMPFGIEREIVIMKLIEHPNITSLYDIWENRGELYLVLEYVEGGELFDYVMRNGALPEGEAVRLLRQMIAGLAYCHRFNICHRDLKPENILLDQDHNIKIADFGMAALQPQGQYLTTSCGSPHYAAPEIITGRQYRGDQADIWSVGIILYAMLNGFLPFDGGDLHSTLALVKRGEYYLSPNLSIEAADLIQRILQKRPERRMTMNEIWRHPLLKKYEKIHASLAAPGKLAGPPPPLTSAECGPRRIKPSEVDRELLRNLQVLWHGLGEDEVVRRLTSEEPNHEKLFYWALIRFREEQLEHYLGDPLQHSASDYHHLQQPALPLPRGATRSAIHQRKNSQFSIVSEDSIVRAAYYKAPGTAASKTTQVSYDPYRSSRTHIGHGQKAGTTIVVRRPGSRASIQRATTSSLRNALLDRASQPAMVPDTSSLDVQELQRLIQQKKATYGTISSLSSMASSQRHRVFRKSTSYRRSVSFRHLHQRQRSSHTPTTSKRHSPQTSFSRPGTRESNQTFSDSRSTPSLPTPNHVTQPRRPASDLDLHSTRGVHMTWREDARHVSAELSKICEEAFNRSSTSYTSDLSHSQLAVDSPATTVSIPESLLPQFRKGHAIMLTPALRNLLERRARIIETWGAGDPKTLADVVETLDRRIVDEQPRIEANAERRFASDPSNDKFKAGKDTFSATDMAGNLKNDRSVGSRAVSDPVRSHGNTIRMVTPASTSPLAMIAARPSKAASINSLKGGPSDAVRNSYDRRLLAAQSLEPILEDSAKSPKKPSTIETKKWSWLSKKASASNEELPPTPPQKDTPKDKQARPASNLSTISADERTQTTTIEETEARKRTWFQKMFKPRRDQKLSFDSDHQVISGDTEEGDDVEGLLTPAPQGAYRRGHRHVPSMEGVAVSSASNRVEASSNWFAKFLYVKPATSVVIMRTSKAHARKEIVKILREWRKFGIRDVAVEKRPSGDIVRARVDAVNYLHIRPVQFFASVYTVLERGKLANLSIVKFTQEKGAASSFRRVVDTMESVLKEGDLVLADTNKKKKILRSMKQAGL
ncbi:serine/threonine-protein kinase gin4 [Lithohypha guttulata]|uniref:non-specific serine/threonine protein kinase n=1 Tax=Lithohypha guttulata TaxID=1690604 RepID=A0AAN7T5X7_9EURO|nr:serine/threonine-protein kinase gin4 [Lithohypha guttulata]